MMLVGLKSPCPTTTFSIGSCLSFNRASEHSDSSRAMVKPSGRSSGRFAMCCSIFVVDVQRMGSVSFMKAGGKGWEWSKASLAAMEAPNRRGEGGTGPLGSRVCVPVCILWGESEGGGSGGGGGFCSPPCCCCCLVCRLSRFSALAWACSVKSRCLTFSLNSLSSTPKSVKPSAAPRATLAAAPTATKARVAAMSSAPYLVKSVSLSSTPSSCCCCAFPFETALSSSSGRAASVSRFESGGFPLLSVKGGGGVVVCGWVVAGAAAAAAARSFSPSSLPGTHS
mmetsp:Transcript_16211/g.27646  ORF Transcript_16211/g.27646 Transcript_16211/m.27646 type:complete len:282 (-) Transcript_16211:148-993(-)